MDIPQATISTLEEFGQLHLVRWWDNLAESQQLSLLDQINRINFRLVHRLTRERSKLSGAEPPEERAARAQPPQDLVRLPAAGEDATDWKNAREQGWDLLADGAVGAILVAGGQGTRLGFDKPKGMFRIGPVSRKSLFQMHCEQLRARARRAGRPIPYFIMTSDVTHAETVDFFRKYENFGLGEEDVFFFQQGALPAIADDETGRILMAAKDRISSSPDGHGGILGALSRAGLLDVMRQRGVEYLFYHQVDNPTAVVCDPVFLGFHAARESQLSTKVVAKESAEERMGVVVTLDGRTEIIEYSDLPPEMARETSSDGRLRLWAGNTAIHVFSRPFLEELTEDDRSLPYHVAHKTVPHINTDGELSWPSVPNANKFEQFIFDALPFAERALVVEADRAREFHPVKNHKGKDSPETSRSGILNVCHSWLTMAEAKVSESARVEISPLYAQDADELRMKIEPGRRFDSDLVME